MPPELWLLAGGNGAGKTTFYERFIARHRIPLVNADRIARALWPADPEARSYEAALIAENERLRLVRDQQTFCFETVFSHPSKLDFLGSAKAAGYRLRVFYFHLGDASLNSARVASRVVAGGHRVPEDKIVSRLPRTFANIRDCVGLADELHLVDNASAREPYQRIASWQDGQWTLHRREAPEWARRIMDPG